MQTEYITKCTIIASDFLIKLIFQMKTLYNSVVVLKCVRLYTLYVCYSLVPPAAHWSRVCSPLLGNGKKETLGSDIRVSNFDLLVRFIKLHKVNGELLSSSEQGNQKLYHANNVAKEPAFLSGCLTRTLIIILALKDGILLHKINFFLKISPLN